MLDLKLKDYQPKSKLITEEHLVQKPKFRVFDAHVHFGRLTKNGEYFNFYPDGSWVIEDVPAAIDHLDQLGVEWIANMDGGFGDLLKQNIERYKDPYPDKFAIFCWVDWSSASEDGEKWARELEKSVKAGAQGLKIFKSLGTGFRDKNGKLIMPDDTVLDPIFQAAGELNIPVMIHTGDPVAFFEPLDENNERYEELVAHPDWHCYGKDYPSFNYLIQRLLHVVKKNPKTKFIGAHTMGYAENLGFVSNALDKYPNLYVDITERVPELGRQPYTSRKFLIDYADRVLFGTDTIEITPEFYRIQYRFLETDDEYFSHGRDQGRWNIYGVYLPDDVLRKIYHENALKLIPGMKK